ncbi:coniferyl aldehyde dehydrogenase [Legionella jamestowniensis]|uniref:Aldehyde dehydrogenase n=1 Tax=Legionella jamestowniensis TaxID=455 RepID=A0A0W0UNL7_9GAMM|nr:coniferyl aldehyde dehydrogenase [Legionella jamestowniensis]KTD09473.1 alcohol dehydrogenase [Legionella jamestowniensis]OCH99296.1 aldehyde dehydrogenase [Legionella jamestowniensis]SFL89943.1 coniferyl-aldehyde dehydrogenase [Legionella jamestowniensis DSM 19215]
MELSFLFEQLKGHCLTNPYPAIKERRESLLTLRTLLQIHAEEIVNAVNTDFSHRARYETLLLEIFPSINAINYCLKNLKKWTKTRKRHVSWLFKPAKAYLLPQPLGVVGIIVPWNYPILLAIGPLVYALAAGNRVMIKMSELTPETGSLFQKLIRLCKLDHQIVIVNGDQQVAQKFTNLPFGHLLFTGSPTVGKLVMKEAAENLVPITLELGGKSPAFISMSCNERHFKRLFMGKMANAGQTCIAPDFLLIPEHWEKRIEIAAKEFVNQHYSQLSDSEDYSNIISTKHQERLMTLLDDARQKGARIVQIGDDSQQGRMPLILLFNVNNTMRVMQEEIFGPILPVMHYKSLIQAIQNINAYPNPLVIYYFGNDAEEVKIVKKNTLSGALAINDTLTHIAIDSLPFGGVGRSGMGHYHGQEGFDVFSKLKPVFVQRRFATTTWFYPPHGKLINFLLGWIAGIHLKEKK